MPGATLGARRLAYKATEDTAASGLHQQAFPADGHDRPGPPSRPSTAWLADPLAGKIRIQDLQMPATLNLG